MVEALLPGKVTKYFDYFKSKKYYPSQEDRDQLKERIEDLGLETKVAKPV